MHKGFIKTAAFIGALSVALGAFGAHKLKEFVPEHALSIFETGVRYQFYHVFALLGVGILFEHGKTRLLQNSGVLFILGIILFSGSLYLMTWFQAAGISGMEWLGPLTPLGGACFIAAWVLLFVGISNKKTSSKSDNGAKN